MTGLRPFWRYFGGKWRAARAYPAPKHGLIVEPFAGAAGYALRYYQRNVILVEKNPVVAGVWRFLIGATRADVMQIPYVEDVADLPASVPEEARWWVGFMLGAGDTRPRARMSSMVRSDGGWNRERMAAQVDLIKHWRVIGAGYQAAPDVVATWFIDPPYQERGARDRRPGARGRVRYPCGADDIDFTFLAQWVQDRRGQVIACENVGATWLPFRALGEFGAAAPGARSAEAVWIREGQDGEVRGGAEAGGDRDGTPDPGVGGAAGTQ